MLATRPRPHTSAPGDGSRTITIHDVPTPEKDEDDDDTGFSSHPRPVLKLRGGPRSAQKVMWDEAVVDNENCGKKKSKICCIYHKPKRFDESSDESSDESDADDGRAKPAARRRHNHHAHDGHDHSHDSEGSSRGTSERSTDVRSSMVAQIEDVRSAPNAYEVQPHRAKGKGKSQDI